MRLSHALAGLALFATGAAVALGPLSPTLVVDKSGDWRQVCPGCRRSGGTREGLAMPRESLVHLHELDGRQRALELWLSAREAPVTVDVAPAPDAPALLSVRLGPLPQRVAIPLNGRETDLDLWLRAGGQGGLPTLLHKVVLVRTAGLRERIVQWLPAAISTLLWVWLVGRLPLPLGFAYAVVALGVAALAALTLSDPLALLEARVGPRERVQTLLLALLAVSAVWRPPSRWLAFPALAAASWSLFLPSARNGLVSDDFLWLRTWTLSDVASTYIGQEDPSGRSNVYYRPLSSTAHAIDSWVWGDHVSGFHVTNLLLHPIVCYAGFALLLRLGLGERAAWLGAMAWAIHPMSASAVAWTSQRTDLIVSFFYVSALAVVLSAWGRRAWPALVPAVLALGSKELAISLPVVAGLLVWFVLPPEEQRGRVRTLVALALLALAHVTWWIFLFPTVAGIRVFGGAARPAAAGPAFLLPRRLVELLSSIAWPLGYQAWWSERLHDWTPANWAGAIAFPLLIVWLYRCPQCRQAPAGVASRLALAWPLVVALPLFGVRLLDFYRLGLLPCFSIALLAGAVARHLEHGGERRPLLLAAALAAWLAPLTLETAREWGPGGFYYEMSLDLEREGPEWQADLSPTARTRFLSQLGLRDHLRDVGERLATER
jgi:hypothetical protein